MHTMRAFILGLVVILGACALGNGHVDDDAVFAIVKEVADSIDYRTDEELYGVFDYWASARETEDALAGDCEDYAILALFRIYDRLGVKGAMLTGHGFNAGTWHAWIEVGGVEYDPTFGAVAPESYETWLVWGYDTLRGWML